MAMRRLSCLDGAIRSGFGIALAEYRSYASNHNEGIGVGDRKQWAHRRSNRGPAVCSVSSGGLDRPGEPHPPSSVENIP